MCFVSLWRRSHAQLLIYFSDKKGSDGYVVGRAVKLLCSHVAPPKAASLGGLLSSCTLQEVLASRHLALLAVT